MILSKNDIESIAQPIIQQYKKAFVPQHYLCYSIDPSKLAFLLGFRVEYRMLTVDGSVLGQTASIPLWTTIIDPNMGETYYFLDGKTILVEERLGNNPKLMGRKNFTIAHELAHQIINRSFPNCYGLQNRVCCDYRRNIHFRKVNNWYEWQADALAAALLLPLEAIEDAMFIFGLGKHMKVLSRKYSESKFECFCQMADYLQVSRTALAYRMEKLGLLDRNHMIKEAQQRRVRLGYEL